MRIRSILLTLAVAAVAFPTLAPAAEGEVGFRAAKRHNRPNRPVVIRLTNDTDEAITLTSDWEITSPKGESLATYVWFDEDKTVGPGATREWPWDQHAPRCYGACQNVWEGEPVGPGRYIVSATTSAGEHTAKFDIGRYFTLGFRSRGDTFVVYASKAKAVRQMRKEAKADEKSLIVSGLVRRGAGYNPDWSYTMGPRSIVLGEAFIGGCDASPSYVEDNLGQWMGERWCPWSSYVKRTGR